MPSEIIVTKIPDRKIIELFDAISERYGKANAYFYIAEISFEAPPEDMRNARKNTYALTQATCSTVDQIFTLDIKRNYNGSPYLDVIIFTPRTNRNPRPTPEQVFELEQLITSIVGRPKLEPNNAVNDSMAAAVEKEIASLAALHKDVTEDALQLKKRYEEQDVERRERFEAEQAERNKKMQALEEESLARISAQKDELDAKMQEFDLSDHMRARRQQREDITTEIQNAIMRPVGSNTSRVNFILTIAFCFMATLGSGVLAFESFQSFVSASSATALPTAVNDYLWKLVKPSSDSITSNQQLETTDTSSANELQSELLKLAAERSSGTNTYLLWMLAIRGALLSAVAVGFSAYLVNLLRRNYDEETRYLRELQRYGMDINRASWIIETAMEMTTKENAKLPDTWIEGACSGLFRFGNAKDDDVNSLSALGALMKLGPEVEVGPNGAKVTVGKNGTKAAAKDAPH